MAIKSFRCSDTEALYEGKQPRRFRNIEAVAERKLQMLEDAVELRDLRSPPGNRLEQLSGDRAGQHSTASGLTTSGEFVSFGRMPGRLM